MPPAKCSPRSRSSSDCASTCLACCDLTRTERRKVPPSSRSRRTVPKAIGLEPASDLFTRRRRRISNLRDRGVKIATSQRKLKPYFPARVPQTRESSMGHCRGRGIHPGCRLSWSLRCDNLASLRSSEAIGFTVSLADVAIDVPAHLRACYSARSGGPAWYSTAMRPNVFLQSLRKCQPAEARYSPGRRHAIAQRGFFAHICEITASWTVFGTHS